MIMYWLFNNPPARVRTACVYSRMENKEKAHEYLTTAVKHGYNTFQRLLKDPDLVYIRSRSDWKSFYKKLRE